MRQESKQNLLTLKAIGFFSKQSNKDVSRLASFGNLSIAVFSSLLCPACVPLLGSNLFYKLAIKARNSGSRRNKCKGRSRNLLLDKRKLLLFIHKAFLERIPNCSPAEGLRKPVLNRLSQNVAIPPNLTAPLC